MNKHILIGILTFLTPILAYGYEFPIVFCAKDKEKKSSTSIYFYESQGKAQINKTVNDSSEDCNIDKQNTETFAFKGHITTFLAYGSDFC